MKSTKTLLLAGALFFTAASVSFAQADQSSAKTGDKAGAKQDGKHRGPPNPLLALFDTNHDGVISADEIANAPAVLKALDKNGDGQLTGDELRPPRPEGGKSGGPDGQSGHRGPGGPGGDLPPPPEGESK